MPQRQSLVGKAWRAVRTLATRRIEFEFENMPVTIPNASYARILNWILAETSVLVRSSKPWGRPTHVQVETSTRCNQRCQYCPVGQELAERTGHLDPATFRRFTDQMGDMPLIFQMWGWGEPFLNESIYEMISYARAKGIPTVSSTNGQIFEQMEQAEKLVRSGLDMLVVSVSGITQDTYGRYRPGSRIDKVFEGLRNIAEQKRRQGRSTPMVSLTFVVSKDNEHEAPLVPRVARELGVDLYSLKRLNPTSTRSERWIGDEHVAGDARFIRLRYREGERVRVKNNRCKALWQGTTLRWDGRVNACPFDFHSKHTLGDAHAADFVQIWTGEQYSKMRRQFREDWNGISICENCTFAFEGGGYDEVFAETVFLSREPSVVLDSP